MSKTTAMLGMVLCWALGLTLGFFLGGGSELRKAGLAPAPVVTASPAGSPSDSQIACDVALEQEKMLVDQKQRMIDLDEAALSNYHQQARETSQASQPSSNVGEVIEATPACADSSTLTILFEPGVLVSIPVLRGLGNVSVGSAAAPSVPHWVLRGRIEPLFVGDGRGFAFQYFDLADSRTSGPAYAPRSVQQAFPQ